MSTEGSRPLLESMQICKARKLMHFAMHWDAYSACLAVCSTWRSCGSGSRGEQLGCRACRRSDIGHEVLDCCVTGSLKRQWRRTCTTECGVRSAGLCRRSGVLAVALAVRQQRSCPLATVVRSVRPSDQAATRGFLSISCIRPQQIAGLSLRAAGQLAALGGGASPSSTAVSADLCRRRC